MAPVTNFSNVTNHGMGPGGSGGQWNRGDRIGLVDSVTGDLLYFIRNYTASRTRMMLSTDSGTSWNEIASTTSADTIGTGPDSVCQTSDGFLHVVCGGDFKQSYIRLSLTRSGGHITAWDYSGSVITYPANSGFPESASIRPVINALGIECLMISAIGYNGDNWDICVTHSNNPTTNNDLFSLSGTANSCTAITMTGSTIFGNDSCTTLEQHPVNSSVYAFWGSTNNESNMQTGIPYGYIKIDPTGGTANWTSTGAATVIDTGSTTYGQVISNSIVTSSEIWILVLRGTAGLCIDKFDSTGTYVSNYITVSAAGYCGTMAAKADGSVVFCSWIEMTTNASTGTVKHGVWNGSSWTTVTDPNISTGLNLPNFSHVDLSNAIPMMGIISLFQNQYGSSYSIGSILDTVNIITTSAVIDAAGEWENLIDGDIAISGAWQNINEIKVSIGGVWYNLVP
jgi:hypothetical protein